MNPRGLEAANALHSFFIPVGTVLIKRRSGGASRVAAMHVGAGSTQAEGRSSAEKAKPASPLGSARMARARWPVSIHLTDMRDSKSSAYRLIHA